MTSVFEKIAERFINALNENIVPWQKPWSFTFGENLDLNELAVSYTTKKPYSLLNQWLLPKGQYISFSNCQKLGGSIKKGAKSYECYGYFPSWLIIATQTWVKVKPTDLDESEYKEIPSMRAFKVFNINDCEGITPHVFQTTTKPTELEGIEEAEKVMQGYLNKYPTLKFHKVLQDRAYYSPLNDEIFVPTLAQYKVKEEFYSTALHEMAHSTGHASRLNRSGITKNDGFGSENYSKEELIAEMASAMTLNYIGIDCAKAFKNSVAYVQSWAKKIKSDPKIVAIAASQAEKASKLILGI